jgi:hypothetical protein
VSKRCEGEEGERWKEMERDGEGGVRGIDGGWRWSMTGRGSRGGGFAGV